MKANKTYQITQRNILYTFSIIGLIWFLYFISDIIFQIFVALLIMAILNPLVTKLEKLKIPRAASVLIVYVVVFSVIGLIVAQITPLLVDQSTKLAKFFPQYVEDLHLPGPLVEQLSTQASTSLASLPTQVIKISVSLFSNVIAVLTVLFFALYFLMDRERLDDHLAAIFKKNDGQQERIDRVINALEKRLGGWAIGQLILMLMVGFSTYLGLLLLGIPFAVPLALIAGLLEIIPNIGPIIASIPAMIIGFGISPLTGLAVAALSFLIQQVETYFFVPKVMERSAGVNPTVTLLALVIGLKVAGVVGAILAIPVVIAAQLVLEEFVYSKS